MIDKLVIEVIFVNNLEKKNQLNITWPAIITQIKANYTMSRAAFSILSRTKKKVKRFRGKKKPKIINYSLVRVVGASCDKVMFIELLQNSV